MPDTPFVSIIIAAYNAERTMGRCIDSLLALDYPAFEIIVVDNNSTDNTPDIVKRYPIMYLLETKKGWPAARNKGISCSSAKYVANIDADCFPSKDWLKNLILTFLASDGDNVGCVVGKTLVEEGKTLAQRCYSESNPFGTGNKIGKTKYIPWGGGNNVMLREAFLKAGGYDSDRFISGADVEFHYRLEGKFGYKTIWEPKALIYHEARGSSKEFFTVAAKYAHDGFLRSRTEEMEDTQDYYHLFALRKFFHISLNGLGIGYRGIKALIGKETWFRVASAYFTIISLSGTIYGYYKGRVKYMLKSSKSI